MGIPIIDDQVVTILLAATLAASLVLAIGVVVLAVRLRRLRRSYVAALGSDRGEDLFASLARQAGELDGLRRDIDVVHGNTEHLRALLGGTVSRLGVVRYDAFEDMGGALSFSAALLDEHGSGVVISAINGRQETRCYAKPVANGGSGDTHELSGEELAAVDAAAAGRRDDVLASTPRRRLSVGARRRAS